MDIYIFNKAVANVIDKQDRVKVHECACLFLDSKSDPMIFFSDQRQQPGAARMTTACSNRRYRHSRRFSGSVSGRGRAIRAQQRVELSLARSRGAGARGAATSTGEGGCHWLRPEAAW